MPATVLIREKNGAGETATDKTSGTIRFKNADNATVDANNPMVKPSSGTDRSYQKWLRMQIGGTGPTGEISNLQFYTDGTNNYGTGIDVYARTTNEGTYTTPAEATTETGATDAFTYATGARKDMDAVNAGPFSTINTDMGDYLVLHMAVASTATGPQNPTASETFTFSWDET